MTLNNKLLSEIKLKRKEKKLSQEDVAKKLSLTQSQYQRIESGHSPISLENLKVLIELFDINKDFILNEFYKNVHELDLSSRIESIMHDLKSAVIIENDYEKEVFDLMRSFILKHDVNLKSALFLIKDDPEFYFGSLFHHAKMATSSQSDNKQAHKETPKTTPSLSQKKKAHR